MAVIATAGSATQRGSTAEEAGMAVLTSHASTSVVPASTTAGTGWRPAIQDRRVASPWRSISAVRAETHLM